MITNNTTQVLCWLAISFEEIYKRILLLFKKGSKRNYKLPSNRIKEHIFKRKLTKLQCANNTQTTSFSYYAVITIVWFKTAAVIFVSVSCDLREVDTKTCKIVRPNKRFLHKNCYMCSWMNNSKKSCWRRLHFSFRNNNEKVASQRELFTGYILYSPVVSKIYLGVA